MNFGEQWPLGCCGTREALVRQSVISDLLVYCTSRGPCAEKASEVTEFDKILQRGNNHS